ncbi:transcription initiation factor TFIID 23-30kDa subunit-domain-containing protein, partial [Multifurca ochricompacta]
ETRKDRSLVDFLLMLDDYEPLIPDEVTEYYLQRVGFDCQDARLKRLLALAAQKFVSDIAADAYQHARIRTNAASGRARANQGPGSSRVGCPSHSLHVSSTRTCFALVYLSNSQDRTRTTLTMEDLSAALSEYGINSRKPEFYL